MALATSEKSVVAAPGEDGKSTPVVEQTAPAPANIALAYTPELLEPGVAIPGGAFSVAFANRDFQRLVLEPGLNFGVDSALWAAAKKLPAVKELLHQRAIEEIPLDGAAGPAVAILRREPEDVANALVHKCRLPQQLREWLAIEERQSVRMSLQRRLKSLEDGVG